MGISALMMGALYASKRFAAPAFAPALLNISLIAAALLLAPLFLEFGWPAIFALAVGALLGGALQIVAQLPSLRKENLIVRPRIGFSDIYVRKCARLMVPLLAGLGVYQLNVLLSRLFASFLPDRKRELPVLRPAPGGNSPGDVCTRHRLGRPSLAERCGGQGR